MASNYVQLNWYEPSWDDDQVGALSSLERRQRKAAEKQDVLAFYSSLGFLFFIVTGLLVWSEIYAFATAPSRALTGAFLLEVWRSAGVAYSQLQILYKYVGELAWIWNAVVYGHDFAQRGVSITHGAAKLLASGLYYHAVILSGLLMYWTYPHVVHAPVRTALLSTLSAGILFGTPPLYALLTSHFCQNCGPEPVVLLALLLAGFMCVAALYMSSSISGRLAGAGATAAAAARQRSQAARRPGCAAAAPGGCQSGNAPFGGGAGGSGGAGPGGSKRNSSVTAVAAAVNHAYGRASSLGRGVGGASGGGGGGGGGFGSGAASGGDWVPGFVGAGTRSASSSSLCGPASFANSGFGCLATAAAAAAGGDPVGALSSSARSLSGLASGGSSSVDLTAPCTESKAGPVAGGGRNRGAGSGGVQSAAKPSSSHDPVAAKQRTGQRGGGGGSGWDNTHGGSSGSGSIASIAKDSKQQQQQQHGRQGSRGASAATGDGVAGSGAAKGKPQSAPARTTAADPTCVPAAAAAGSSTGTSSGGGKNAAATAAPNKANVVPDPVAAPAPAVLKKKAPTSSNASSSTVSLSATANVVGGHAAAATASAAGAGRHSAAHAANSSANAVVGNSACTATSNPVHIAGKVRSDMTSSKAGAAASGAGGGKSASSSPVTPATTSTVSTIQTSIATAPAAAATAAAAASSAGATGHSPATAGGGGAGGLLARLTATVTAAASAAPVLSGRGAKKATAGASRKQPGQQPPQQPQYVIVPPPPPPPRKLAGGACEAQPHLTTTAAAAASVNGSPTAAASQPVRNAWLNPNPVIKLAAGMAKGPKGAATAAGRTAAPHPSTAATPGAASATRSTGGAPPGNAPPQPPPARSASCGGGVTSTDSRVIATRSCEAAAAACNDPVSPPPPPICSPTAAVGDPVSPSMGHGPVVARQLQASGCGGHPAAESVVSATIIATHSSVGPLVVHKHASGDLDIASAAANYLPYPSTTLASAVVPAVPPNADVDSDSFSFFSIPPPAISDAGPDPAAPPGAPDADAAPYNLAQALYGMYGGNNFASLSSFAADPVWSPNVPTALFPPAPSGVAAAAAAARASRVPPPGFPSHAYGGAFATGPFPAAAWSQPQPPNPLAAAAGGAIGPADAAGRDVPPLPPANDSGVLASLGFLDEAADSNSGGGEDGAGSCAICWSAPRQVGFLHGKTSHLCVCRKCAAQLREGVHRCPMCRQLIERIIDIF